MTSDTVIGVEGVSKRYLIGHQRDSRDALRHRIESVARHPFRWWRQRRNALQAQEEFWALKDVSFETSQGDAVAIIGRNGAGKSTLLKILSRITEPTKGRIYIRGRAASLLEVGTGFHQELTGRENVFLNGAILGMTRAEITRKFDEIVAFAEIEKFLDTPVKRYSTGMYVRLAFAIAAHLEPEILIVDEVLAVGDAQFQKKCLGKMGQAATNGRTVLFVSHNIPAVQALCKTAIYLQHGTVIATGSVESVVQRYLTDTEGPGAHTFKPVRLSDDVDLLRFDLTPNPVSTGDPIHFTIQLRANNPVTILELNALVETSYASRLALMDLRRIGLPITLETGNELCIAGTINSVPFVEGDYSIGLYLNAGSFLDNHPDLVTLTVRGRVATTGFAPYPVIYRGLVELEFTADRAVQATCV